MGKKSRLSQSVVARKRKSSIDQNPFEVRVNRKKHDVLGQRREKGERGLPGVSRSHAIEKRKKTLLKEYKQKQKTNQFIDKRFGEDEDLPEEERLMQRYLLEKKRRHERTSIYNLEDDEEELTHYGQSLGKMEYFDDIVLSSDDDNYTEVDDTENHFGGFLHKKRSSNLEENERKRTRQEIMTEVAKKSKLHKYERQVEREKIEELLEDVDAQWKDIQTLMTKSSRTDDKSSCDDYDQYIIELAREPRGQPSEPLKSEQDLAKEEKEHLERLEAERQDRMKSKVSFTSHHISADDDIKTRVKPKDSRVMIQYHDGQLMVSNETINLLPDRAETFEDQNEGEQSGNEQNNEEQSETEDNEQSGNEDNDEEQSGNEDNDEEQSGNEKDEEHNVECYASDLESDDNEGAEEEEEDVPEITSVNNEIPFTLETVPASVKELMSLTHNRSPEQCCTILERIYTCHHPSLSVTNKSLMESFLPVLLDYCLHQTNVHVLDQLIKPLFKLAQINPQHTMECFKFCVNNAFKRYQKLKKSSPLFPQLSELLLFKLVSVIFPTSDYSHTISTPCLYLMSLALTQSRIVSNMSGLCTGLCLCKLLTEYIVLSKKYVPQLICYLTSVLNCFLPHSVQGYPPFTTKTRSVLSLHTCLTLQDNEPLLNFIQLLTCTDPSSNHTKLSILALTLQLIHTLTEYWQNSPSYDVIFTPILEMCTKLQPVNQVILGLVDIVIQSVQRGVSQPKPILQLLRRKPKSIVFFEPKFEENYQPGKKKAHNKTLAERMKLKHKYKREMKGAVREIRKDNKFLAREKLHEQLARDTERKKRVKQIESWLQEQQADMKTERLKKKK